MTVVTRAELNRRLDVLEANRLTPARAAALAAHVKATPGEALTVEQVCARLGLPATRTRLPRLRVTLKPFAPDAGLVWIVWPDGTECTHPSLADARTCPNAVDRLSARRAAGYGPWLRLIGLVDRLARLRGWP